MNNDKNKRPSDHDILVLTTDPDANIRYVSDDFCRLSGYARHELYGKNIKILRHPQMPSGPFDQLWETVTAGQPWMGIILNRNRHGDDMWLDTYIIPTLENDAVTEYQVVYRQPTEQVMRFARSIYEQRRLGKTPKALSRKQFELGTRISLFSLLSLTPMLSWMMWQQPDAGSFLAASLSAVMAIAGSKLLTRRFKQLVDTSRRIVSHPVKQLIYTGTTDDIGQLELVQCQLQSQLDAVLRRIQDASNEVKRSSDTSDKVMNATFDNLQSQTNALEQIAVTVEEMTATTSNMAKNTQLALDQVNRVQQDAELGTDVVHQAVNAIKQLDAAIDTIGENLSSLEARNSQIDKVVEVIHDIAEQTNLLALNAAIEAARAGENGRGFAVVADEVRSLALRTRMSTQEIGKIIEGLQAETRDISSAIKSGQSLAGSTVHRIEDAGHNLISILSAVDVIGGMTSEIASSTHQQSAATQEVNEQIHTISNAASLVSDEAEKTLEMNRSTLRLANMQSNMVERIISRH